MPIHLSNKTDILASYQTSKCLVLQVEGIHFATSRSCLPKSLSAKFKGILAVDVAGNSLGTARLKFTVFFSFALMFICSFLKKCLIIFSQTTF